jgi:hypothetical protein
MKKLPLGIQTFKKIRDKSENYLYVDKTKIALKLINNGTYYFLSRPRRFGKSLFIDTLDNIFSSNRELFEGLYIYDKWNWETKYPVIKLSFGAGVIKDTDDLNVRILTILEENQKKLNLQCTNVSNSRECFKELIQLTYDKYQQQVVILVDEYDKPILDSIEDKEGSTQIRDGLKNLYSVIKDSDQYIKFAFLTGVSKFSKVSLFSGINNLKDISLITDYATICGYTHQDIQEYFNERLSDLNLDELKQWYNGYNFLGDSVYNPYDILLFFDNHKEYRNYWFETGNPSFLLKILKQNKYHIPNLEQIEVSEEDLGSFDVDDIKLETLLFQTGYLTIKNLKTVFNQRIYYLGYPNLEVRSALNNSIFKYLLSDKSIKRLAMFNAILDKDMEQFKQAIFTLFASIPSDNYRKNPMQNYEGYYASVMYSYLAGLGINFIAEDVTNKGRIDVTIATPNMVQVYIIEFKVLDNESQIGNALEQIKQKRYYEKYQDKTKELYIVGIEFCKSKRNICGFEWEKIGLSKT